MSLTSLLPPGLSLLQGIKLFVQLIADTTVVNRAAAAASTWVAYDICLTLGEEVELVWKARWSLPKTLYFCVRYYGLACSLLYLGVNSSADPPFGVCRGWPWFEAFGAATAVAVLFGEGMFVLRLWASYRENKYVLALIAFCFTAELASSITVGIIEARTITILPRPAGLPIPGCYTLANVPLRNSLGAWIVNCTIATTFFALMLYKFFTGEAFKFELSEATRNPLAKWTEVRRFSPLLYLLLRDGTTYFAMIFLVNAVNMALSIREEGRALEGMGVAWTIAVSSVASSRLLLNLRGFISGNDNMSGGKSERTTMRFEDNLATSETLGQDEDVTCPGDIEECARESMAFREIMPDVRA
ncbi:hypothetical protein BD311DRAFT_766059 [Dichomitus squalens]|uniref:DUF6533 domain-containing protein n=1 Tax=Dichomitus squalens TaxID=114155 RepID=A0A4Q9MC23_9APHY|nr:hypothetical protein BD311DRAFT_766059 [Dichomitus squalens]